MSKMMHERVAQQVLRVEGRQRAAGYARGCTPEALAELVTVGETWRAQWLAEGEAKGLARGKAEALVCLLISRFGALPPSYRKRVRGAKLAGIERWFNRALDAHDLPSVFNRSR